MAESHDPPLWTKEQIEKICRAYTSRQPLVCPECGGAIRTDATPGTKPDIRVTTFCCAECSRSTSQSFTTITPQDFILKPYHRCPKCGEEKFGLLFVSRHSYSKRCALCLHSETYALPRLRKSVIYLDQPAISNMMFALNPETEQFKAKRVDEAWLRLFEKLDRLTKLQLIICPDTHVQEEESLANPNFEALRRTYEQLSLGVSFKDHITIERFQLCVHAANWLEGRPDDAPQLDRDQVIDGDLDGWTDVMRVAVRSRVTDEQVAAIREMRDQTADGIASIFERWQKEKGLRFEEWFDHEVGATGPTILGILDSRTRRMAEIQGGLRAPTMEDIYQPPAVVTAFMIQRDFERRGLSPDEASKKVREYLTSPHLRNVPNIRITAMLWAAIARKAAAGQKRPPSRGTANDIRVIGSILPYCDALFVDNEMRGYLAEEPLATDLQYGARIFSKNNLEEFLDYLDEIERSASPEHLALVERVYGKDWGKPFVEMFHREE